jgi:uncharacterized protein YdiU (UPF0061 family)
MFMDQSPNDSAALSAPFPFDNSYARLPARFFARQRPSLAEAPMLLILNEPLAIELGLDVEALRRDGAAFFSGNAVPGGADPLAMAYAAHQFGNFVPQLGDGRAILLGEVIDINGKRRDIQLKGAGQTAFSRGGDGRAALGPAMREYIVSEAMHALGLPTTRALALVSTGEPVYRETPLPGAVVTRVAASHIRIGTFQFFAARGDNEGVKALADYVIDRHYPFVRDSIRPYLALFEAIVERQAALVASWLHIGFIHGVMNTDNMTVSGETIDFGPCAFMDTYDPATVFSSIDRRGRYAYANQPGIAQWNLARLGETLLPLFDDDPEKAVELANDVIKGFGTRFQDHWLAGMRRKIGLATEEDGDLDLIQALLALMEAQMADFTLTFRRLCDLAASGEHGEAFAGSFANPDVANPWLGRWRERLGRETGTPEPRAKAMRAVNPAFIPRNHRIEQAIVAAIGEADFSPFHRLLDVLSRPYEDQPAFAAYAEAPKPAERVLQTFCGT